MFKWLRERKKRQLKALQAEILQEESEKALDNPEGKQSDQPWVTIVGDTVSEEGIQLSLDWNDAFIKFLKAQGVTGTDDTQIVQKWLAMIAQQQAEMLGQNRLDLEGKTNEYE